MNWLWISGWAVPPSWLTAQAQAAWPEARHVGVAPSAAAHALTAEKFDALGGYSLGALWLLHQAKDIPSKIPVLLLAPILAFAAERNRGGRVALAQLQLQRRRLRNQPAAALADFFQRAGLAELIDSPETKAWNSTRLAALDEELSWLEEWTAAPPPEHWRGVAGLDDSLLDATLLKKLWPALRLVPNTGHSPGPLFKRGERLFINCDEPCYPEF